MRNDISSVEIKQEHGHFVVTVNGEFYCSADSMTEARQEVEALA